MVENDFLFDSGQVQSFGLDEALAVESDGALEPLVVVLLVGGVLWVVTRFTDRD